MDGYGLEHISGATLLQEKRGYGALNMLRGPEGRPLAGEEREAFLLLVRHVQRAIALHRRLAVAERRSGMLAELADRLSVGVVLVDARGGVVHANGAAERIARLGDGFSLGRYGVAGASGSSSAALRGRSRARCTIGSEVGFHEERPGSRPRRVRGRARRALVRRG